MYRREHGSRPRQQTDIRIRANMNAHQLTTDQNERMGIYANLWERTRSKHALRQHKTHIRDYTYYTQTGTHARTSIIYTYNNTHPANSGVTINPH